MCRRTCLDAQGHDQHKPSHTDGRYSRTRKSLGRHVFHPRHESSLRGWFSKPQSEVQHVQGWQSPNDKVRTQCSRVRRCPKRVFPGSRNAWRSSESRRDSANSTVIARLDQSLSRLQFDHRQRRQRMRAESFESQLHQAPMKPGARPTSEHERINGRGSPNVLSPRVTSIQSARRNGSTSES